MINKKLLKKTIGEQHKTLKKNYKDAKEAFDRYASDLENYDENEGRELMLDRICAGRELCGFENALSILRSCGMEFDEDEES